MESFFVRYRNLVVLLAVLVAQIAGLAVQVRRTEGGQNTLDATDTRSVRLIRYWAESLVAPPELAFHDTRLGIEYLWASYLDLRHVRQQNRQLEQAVDRLRLEQAELLEDAHQGERLQALLGFEQRYIYATVPAQVFGSSGSDQSKLFYIDKGSAEGLKRDMPVITADGIVGKVRDVFPHTAQVLAINDQTSGAGVILETTRIRGVLKGDAMGRLEVVGLMSDQRIKPGEKVLTAGGDLIFPRGLPVGTVEKVIPDPDRDSFIDVMVKPAANLNQLDEVLVITSTAPQFPNQQKQDMTTSKSLEGAEAARDQAIQVQTEQDQMKASEIMAERLPGLTDGITPAGTAPQAGAGAGQNGAAAVAQPPAPKLLPTRRPDRFSPGAAPVVAPDADSGLGTAEHAPSPHKSAATPKPAAKPSTGEPATSAGAGRNP